jgi:hypothetical protein
MGKYGKIGRQVTSQDRPWKVHPIWMGIGCLLLILIPIISYAGAALLVQANIEARWIAVSADLMRTITIPVLGLKIPHLLANLLAAFVLALIGFGVLMIIYAIIYSIIGPEKYSPLDSPPVRRSPKSSTLKK